MVGSATEGNNITKFTAIHSWKHCENFKTDHILWIIDTLGYEDFKIVSFAILNTLIPL